MRRGLLRNMRIYIQSKNEFEPFIGQCFFSEEEAFIFYKLCKLKWFYNLKMSFGEKNGEIGRHNFFCHREGRQPLKMVDPSKLQ